MLVKWSLSESNSYDSEGTFSVYFGFGDYDILAGTTKDHFFEILGLVSHVKFNVRVELKYPYSGIIISATTHHLLALTNPTDFGHPGATTGLPTNSNPVLFYMLCIIIAMLFILVAILILVLFIYVSIYQQVVTNNTLPHSIRPFLYTKSVEVPAKQKSNWS